MRTIPIRLDTEFGKLIKQIKIDRIKLGTDTEFQSDRRLSKAIARAIKQDISLYDTLIKSPLDKDTRR